MEKIWEIILHNLRKKTYSSNLVCSFGEDHLTFTPKTWKISHTVKPTLRLLSLNYLPIGLVEKIPVVYFLFIYFLYRISFQSVLYKITEGKIERR